MRLEVYEYSDNLRGCHFYYITFSLFCQPLFEKNFFIFFEKRVDKPLDPCYYNIVEWECPPLYKKIKYSDNSEYSENFRPDC